MADIASKAETAQVATSSRRSFLYGLGALSAAGLLGGTRETWAQGRRRRFAQVGLGLRSSMYRTAIEEKFKDTVELVGFCDRNLGRLMLAQRVSKRRGFDVPIYKDDAFDQMIAETKPDAVIVTSMDSTHDHYIIRAMELGCDVVTEKPLTTDAVKLAAIIEAQQRTGKTIRVAFNYRYSPARTQVKELLVNGVIGDILSVDFHWMLNTHHGADYFRRWHSHKANSGGLMVHKATHHFDLVNWWLSALPVSVHAEGKRDFYTPAMARRLGLSGPHERCHTCPEFAACGFSLDLAADKVNRELYLDQERYDGYFRDQCVFRANIDIEDVMNVIVKYDSDVTLSYSLNAFNAWEGQAIAFNGTKGRLEHQIVEQRYVPGEVPGKIKIEYPDLATIRVYPLRGTPQDIEPWTSKGAHGGGDTALLEDLFSPTPPPDPYLRHADYRAGAFSILTGIAANESMRTGSTIKIADLVAEIERPDYPEMPAHTIAVTMPLNT